MSKHKYVYTYMINAGLVCMMDDQELRAMTTTIMMLCC